MADEGKTAEGLEAEVFRALDHQVRRDMIRYVGERRAVAFTEVLNALKVPDSPTLAYHLKALAPFIAQEGGRYRLTPMGKDAYSLLLKSGTYGRVAAFQGKRWGATLGGALLWAIAAAAGAYLGASITLTAIIMPFCAFICAGTTWQLFAEVR